MENHLYRLKGLEAPLRRMRYLYLGSLAIRWSSRVYNTLHTQTSLYDLLLFLGSGHNNLESQNFNDRAEIKTAKLDASLYWICIEMAPLICRARK